MLSETSLILLEVKENRGERGSRRGNGNRDCRRGFEMSWDSVPY